MKGQNVQVKKLVEVPELKNFYSEQTESSLKSSIEDNGIKSPIIVSEDYKIIDGYRRVQICKELGIDSVPVFVVDEQPTISERITRNITRDKTSEDKIKEMQHVFKRFPKRQGKRKEEGKAYVRHEKISEALGGRWKGDVILNKLEKILASNFENNILSRGILEKGWKVDTCYDFLTKWREVDQKNNYGYSKKLIQGELSVNDVNKLIESRQELDSSYTDTFLIPEKAISYNIDCTELGNMSRHFATVDTIFTSVPYYALRYYENKDGKKQPGLEESKEEYCERIAGYFKSLMPLLKESSNVLINIGETYDKGVGLGIPDLLKTHIERIAGLVYKDRLVWSKDTTAKPQNETIKRTINNIEYILWFVVNPEKAKFNLLTYSDRNKSFSINKGAREINKHGDKGGREVFLGKPYNKFYSHLKEQEVMNVIECKAGKNHDVYKICSEGHPAIMSAALPVVPIMMTTDEGDVVCDPFAGSNVVGRVACLLNRRALTTELSKKYYDIGCEMIKKGIDEFDVNSLEILNRTFYAKSVTVNKKEVESDLLKNQIFDTNTIRNDVHKTYDGGILFNCDNIKILSKLSDNSIDSIVTDPPYHISSKTNKELNLNKRQLGGSVPKGIMGKNWDGGDISFNPEFWKECLRILKPGGHLLSFGFARTYHNMAAAVESAGFEIRDQLMWVYGSGFPKSHNLGKDIDKLMGNQREIIHRKKNHKKGMNFRYDNDNSGWIKNEEYLITKGHSIWEGWGTGLRPAHEPIVMARKPISAKSIAKNLLNHGTGGINIDGCRLKSDVCSTKEKWPTNILAEEEIEENWKKYFYYPKASKIDKEEGLSHLKINFHNKKEKSESILNTHPTVKPTQLMRHLVRLVTPKGGICLDPFGGSGSTAKACIQEGFRFVLIEKDKEYHDIAKTRVEFEYSKKQEKLLSASLYSNV